MQDAEAVEEQITAEQERAQEAMQGLSRLTEQEAALHRDMAEAQDKIEALEASIAEQEEELAGVEAEAEVVRKELEALTSDRDAAEAELSVLLRGLWPLHVLNLAGRGRNVETWERADREFTWMAAVYRSVNRKFEEVRDKQEMVRRALAAQEELAQSIRSRIEAVNQDKDGLLAMRLDFMAKLSDLRQEIRSQEEEVQLILAAIDDLRFDLQASRPPEGATIEDMKGQLEWPAPGQIIAHWAPREDPPVRGVGLSLSEGSPVRSVYWGKVVHDGVLRGFGRVIILLHDGDCYTLYAFLSDSEVEVGQNVALGQRLGQAGFYPVADGTGLYFELRFGPRPVNPEEWLQEPE